MRKIMIQNKNNGSIYELAKMRIRDGQIEMLTVRFGDKKEYFYYDNFSQLHEEWRDYRVQNIVDDAIKEIRMAFNKAYIDARKQLLEIANGVGDEEI